MQEQVKHVTERITERSRNKRQDYLQQLATWQQSGPNRGVLSCGNLAHGFAAAPREDKMQLRTVKQPNIGIVSAYNDMLSAHQPLNDYPDIIKQAARELNCTAQFAGGVPAMCDGVTQGQPGMELSLFSRDTIAMATAIALSHNMFDAALCLGVCDKIVPGLLMGVLSFGYLPAIFVPAGPMASGLPNDEKANVRKLFAQGKATRAQLLKAESESYHSPGTCTFYGTANSNQMLMEVMGLHMPGAAFIHPGTPLRAAITHAAARRVIQIGPQGNAYRSVATVVDERAIVNGMIGLLATGGSTNHTLHLVAIAKVAGIDINWDDFADLSAVVPLLTRIYPNGQADVNHFHAAGGMAFLIGQLLDGGLLHADTTTVFGENLQAYRQEPYLDGESLKWRAGPTTSLDSDILRPLDNPFSYEGGLSVLKGNLGRAVIKTSAVKPEHRVVEAPAVVFQSQHDLQQAFKNGELERNCIAVVRYQGPKANGMPELHKLTPHLAVAQDKGYKVGLLTDGRMSGASGKVPAAIHLTPEALSGGAIARLRDGDIIRLDAEKGVLEVKLSAQALAEREIVTPDLSANDQGMGRNLFTHMRNNVSSSEEGASVFFNV